ncbi:ATR-interacting protein-like [Crassostrea angulata]|uniref:ATR-interacting protein-like n=1 Tax=Magallana angulata TaxID=2784310 RepID=UPI0022B0AE39|nr:ATR-interacting protein-like [Crassostrea angulata]
MANNPLFSCIKPGKRFTYNLEASKESPPPGKYRPLQSRNVSMQEANIKSPKAKRRRTEEEEEQWDDDDDDFMLTQENIAELDEMTQAAIRGQKSLGVSDPGPSTTPLSRSEGVKAQSAPAYNTSTPTSRVTFKHPVGPGVSDISLSRPSDSSSSKNSSNTTYPSSLSIGRRSTSLSSHDNSSKSAGSEEIPFQPIKRKPSLSSTNSSSMSSESLGIKSPISEGMREELETYRKQCQSQKEEMESIKQELYVKQGENKILREKLTEKDSELGAIKQQKMKLTEQQMKEQSQKEKQLKQRIQSLNAQLQFQERDLAKMRDKCRDLELAMTAAGDSQVAGTSSSHQSPRVVKKIVVSPKGRRGGFPSTKTFLAEEGSQLVPAQQGEKGEVQMVDAATSANITEEAKKIYKSRNFRLKVEPSKGMICGNHLLSKLSETSVHGCGPGSGPDKGVMGLLQSNPVSMDLHTFLFDRDSSKMLSPIPTKRMSDKKLTADRPRPRPIVSTSSYARAMEGLHSILKDTLVKVSHTCTFSDQSTSLLQTTHETSVSHNGLFFLPLVNDYLSHYIEMMNSYVERGQTLLSPQSSSSSSFGPSSSGDSSMDSLTSSLNVLLRDGAAYANNLESLALCALHVLYKLVLFCEAVQDILLASDDVLSDSSVSSFEKVDEMDTDHPSSSLNSTTSSHGSMDSVRQSLMDCHLLSKILRLANPGRASSDGEGPKKFNEWVVHRALSIIKVLAENCKETQITQLLPVLSKGVLSSCLRCTSTPRLVLTAVQVMSSLTKHHRAVSSACCCPDHCVFLSLYQLCSTSSTSVFPEEVFVDFAANALTCLSNVPSNSKLGSSVLLDTECNTQLQKSVVLLLHKILLFYQTNQSAEARRVLQRGALFLHNLSQVDGQFEERQYMVQHQYTELIFGLNALFKPAAYENERNAVTELWYLGREDSDSSQEDEEEMEIS